MMRMYDILRQKYITEGYTEAFEYLEAFKPKSQSEELVFLNFYSYIIIQSEFKLKETIDLLEENLENPLCSGSLRALTMYHITQALFKIEEFQECKQKSQQIVQQFIGQYYSLEKRLERTEEQTQNWEQLQEILYNTFLLIAYIYREEEKLSDSQNFLDAGRRIMKEKKNLLMITGKAKSFNYDSAADKENAIRGSFLAI